ncbi:MAG TPA: hypothetical protein VJB96_00990 [Patescibacteria group bacterium]|nr:hypothetical protein [Patescibacteria group bacterium]
MRVFAFWPAIVIIFWIGIDLYYRIRPCDPGLLVGFCGLGLFLFRAMLMESVLLYTILFTIWRSLKKKE